MVKSTINGHCQLYVYQRVCLVGWVNPFPLISLPIFPATSAPRMIRSNTQPGLVGKLPNQDRSPRRDVLPAPLSNDLAECLSQMVQRCRKLNFLGCHFFPQNPMAIRICCRGAAEFLQLRVISRAYHMVSPFFHPTHQQLWVIFQWTCGHVKK